MHACAQVPLQRRQLESDLQGRWICQHGIQPFTKPLQGGLFLEIFIRSRCQQMIGENTFIDRISGQRPDMTIIFYFLFCHKERNLEIGRKKNSVDGDI